MKKSGIVLIIFALIIFLVGIGLCQYAKSAASSEGINIYQSSNITGDESTRTVDLTDEMNYFIVDLDSAIINIYGNSDKNQVELVNFTDNNISVKSAGITVSNSKDTFNVIYDTLKNFNGVRNLLFPEKTPTGDKKINVYLKGDYNLTQIKLSLKNGDINISDVESNTDYTVSLGGEGNISLSNVKTKSKININANICKKISLTNIEYNSFKGNITDGTVYLTEKNPSNHLFDTKCENGTIYYNSESQGNKFAVDTAMYQNTFVLEVKNGKIYISDLTENDNSGENVNQTPENE